MAITNKVNEEKTKMDEIVAFLKNVPYSKVDSYIDSNVTSLAKARAYLKKLTKVLLYLMKKC